MYTSCFIFPLLCHRATSSWAVPSVAQGLTQHPLFLITWDSLGIAGITIRWFRHDHFHISSGKSWGFFPLVCVPLVETILHGQQMFYSALSAKGFNGRSKKWCPQQMDHMCSGQSPYGGSQWLSPVQSLHPGIPCDHKTQSWTQKTTLLW